MTDRGTDTFLHKTVVVFSSYKLPKTVTVHIPLYVVE